MVPLVFLVLTCEVRIFVRAETFVTQMMSAELGQRLCPDAQAHYDGIQLALIVLDLYQQGGDQAESGVECCCCSGSKYVFSVTQLKPMAGKFL